MYLAHISQVPSLAQLRIATTPRSIAGYRYSNEQVRVRVRDGARVRVRGSIAGYRYSNEQVQWGRVRDGAS